MGLYSCSGSGEQRGVTRASATYRPRVLMATFHDWASPLPLGSHHLSRAFVANGWDVAHVSAAISPLQFFRDRDEFRGRFSRYHSAGVNRLDGHLWTYMPAAILTPHNVPLLRSRVVHRHWQKSTLPNVVRTVRRRGFSHIDLLYIDTPTQAFWLNEVEFDLSVARIGDRYAGFGGVPGELLKMERELIRSVDLVMYSARELESDIRAAGANRTLHLPNGVDFAHFADGDTAMPSDYLDIPRPIAVYVGEMAEWFDYDKINDLAKSMPTVSFVLIGPDQFARKRIASRNNVHVLGRRPFDRLPAYLHNADVGLMPFDVDRHPSLVHAVHPLKLYEYLACGLPVVATRWDELERLGSPAMLCDTTDDFEAAITSAIDEEADPAVGVEYARAADWTGRVRLILDAIQAKPDRPS